MKSTAVNAGNVNLKGKKTKLLNCGCCMAENLRDKELAKQADKEMRFLTRQEERDLDAALKQSIKFLD